ncbi:MAG: nucleotidyltransferase domain-containing protein [Actinobacteria bacterium]|nr:nucleotidyltransferase domain-containing protein [Actinomycetota bacterium]
MALALAADIAEKLAGLEGLVAIALGGSVATGRADETSDIDIGLYYRPTHPFDLDELNRLIRLIDDRRAGGLATGFGDWGPWVNGGAWLQVRGRRVDLIYRDLDRVRAAIEECRAGRVPISFQVGHPASYSPQIYAGEIALCRPLEDPQGAITALKSLTRPYPAALRRALVDGLWEADFLVKGAASAAARGDVYFVAGVAHRTIACLVQALFAVNERYWTHEKGAVELIDSLAIRPADFSNRVRRAMGQLGTEPLELTGSLGRLRELHDETVILCERALSISSKEG